MGGTKKRHALKSGVAQVWLINQTIDLILNHSDSSALLFSIIVLYTLVEN